MKFIQAHLETYMWSFASSNKASELANGPRLQREMHVKIQVTNQNVDQPIENASRQFQRFIPKTKHWLG